MSSFFVGRDEFNIILSQPEKGESYARKKKHLQISFHTNEVFGKNYSQEGKYYCKRHINIYIYNMHWLHIMSDIFKKLAV